jgi:glucose 1-dehydrogenase
VVNYLKDRPAQERTKAAVEAEGGLAIVVQADVSGPRPGGTLFDEAEARFGRVDVLMNNAGVDASGVRVADLDLDEFDRSLRNQPPWPAHVRPAVTSGGLPRRGGAGGS